MSRALRLGLGGALLLLMAWFCRARLEVDNSIAHFIAAGDDARMAWLAKQLSESELTRTTILVLDAGDEVDEAIDAGIELERRLAEDPEVEWVRGGWDASNDRAFQELYFPHRLHFLSDRPEAELPERLSDEGLRTAARELKRQLALPTAPMIKGLAGDDPLLAYKTQLDRLRAAQSGRLQLVRERFVSEAGEAVLVLSTRHSAFDTAVQGPFHARIDQAVAEIAARSAGGLTLQRSAVARFAIDAESRIRADVTRISVASTLGVVLLLVVVFRSPRALVLSMLPLACGVLTALTVSLALYGRIHGLTLAFGSTLIGVCIDYPLHLFNHHALGGGASPAATCRRILPGLALGAGTTIVGFAALAWTSFPGIREIATFASVGVAAALAATVLLLPTLMSSRAAPSRLHLRVQSGLAEVIRGMAARRRWLWVGPLLAFAVGAAGLPRLRFVDSVAALSVRDPAILAEDEAVRDKVSRMDAGRLIVAIHADEEVALAANDEVYQRLGRLREDGAIADFRSLHDFLWSPELQRRSRAALCEDPTLSTRLRAAFESEGFRGEAFAGFAAELAAAEPAPLRRADLEATPLGGLISGFRAELGDEVGILTLLRGVDDPQAVEAALADLDDVYYFDQQRLMEDIYSRNRVQTLQLIGFGLVAVLLLVLARYRRLGLALAAFLPALLAGGATIAVLALFSVELNLMHIVALLLVLSMGVDYGVFLAESQLESHPGAGERQLADGASTLVGLLLACVSTVLAFGLLALSSNPGMRAIGTTTGLGVLLSFVLAPTTLLVLAGRRRGGPR